ncbi:hypothetical protein BGW39_009646 [Mortierella sp. 14UC]|nr:hypothetical protein BGW39_009646 [Mortierella sp. 14UC]
MSTSISSERFFDIPELVALLAPYLNNNEIARLTRTCHKMREGWTPLLFTSLTVCYDRKPNMFTSVRFLNDLAQNTRQVRRLKIDVNNLVFYYNRVFVFEGGSVAATSDVPTVSPLAWTWPTGPSGTTNTPQLVPLPPMTCLSQLSINLGASEPLSSSAPLVVSPRMSLAQLCWLTSLNLGLTTLKQEGAVILDLDGAQLFGEALYTLVRLRKLEVWVYCSREEWSKVWSILFFSLPPSIRQLSVTIEDFKSYFGQEPWSLVLAPAEGVTDSDEGEGEEGEEDEEQDDDDEEEEVDNDEEDMSPAELSEDAATPTFRNSEPLINQEMLKFEGMYNQDWTSLPEIRSLFAHCPNIKDLDIFITTGRTLQEITALGQFIAESCPYIERLRYGTMDAEEYDLLGYQILAAMPPQQVTHVDYTSESPDIIVDPLALETINTAFRRHSTTLRSICLDTLHDMSRISVSTILKECYHLEKLIISCNSYQGIYSAVDDLLDISGCELPVEARVQPYYSRPAPITLTPVETHHFARLGELYRRIGALTKLRVLNLQKIPLDDTKRRPDRDLMRQDWTFPAMLSLQDTKTAGNPTRFGLEETKATVGREEALWIDRYWPRLEHAGLFFEHESISAPFH